MSINGFIETTKKQLADLQREPLSLQHNAALTPSESAKMGVLTRKIREVTKVLRLAERDKIAPLT